MPVTDALGGTARTAETDAAGPLAVYAAGSLRAPLTDIAHEFARKSGFPVTFEFGAAGLLKQRILAGAPAAVFASANAAHPRALAQTGKAFPEQVFARNRLCALARADLRVTPDLLLSTLLDPNVRVATSTPEADPCGDYAWDVFRKAEGLQLESFAALCAKALQLTGSPRLPKPVPGRNVYGAAVAEGRADIFLTYYRSAALALKEFPDLRVIDLPEELSVEAQYGVAVLKGAPPSANRFVECLFSREAQFVLREYGFR